MTKILVVAACVAIPVILLSFLMENYKLDDMEQHVKGVVIGAAVPEPALRRQSSAYFEDPEHAFRSSLDSEEGEEEPMLRRALSSRGLRSSNSSKMLRTSNSAKRLR
jgi:hypothetical protein